jgi:hypothetical protein
MGMGEPLQTLVVDTMRHIFRILRVCRLSATVLVVPRMLSVVWLSRGPKHRGQRGGGVLHGQMAGALWRNPTVAFMASVLQAKTSETNSSAANGSGEAQSEQVIH